MIKSVSNFITEYLRKNNSSLSLTDLMKIDYVIQMILGDLAKFLTIFLIFLYLNEVPIFLFSFIVIFSTRPLAGGIHCKTFWGCLTCSILFYLTILAFSIFLSKFNTYFYIAFFILSLISIWRYAPSVNTKIPIKNKKNLKIFTLISFTFWMILFFMLSNFKMRNCILATTLLQIVQLIILNIKGDVSNAKIYKRIFSHTT